MNSSANSKVVLDASALLALIQEERGANVVRPLLKSCVMSTINVAEVLSKLQDLGVELENSIELIADIIPNIIDFNFEQARHTAALRPSVRSKGLSLADRACIALGIELQVPVYTADKIWADIDLDCEIILIR